MTHADFKIGVLYIMINEEYFNVWSNKMAYILGFTIADGCVLYKGYSNTFNGHGYSLRYHIHTKDKEILEFIKSELAPNNSIKEYVNTGNDGIVRRSANLIISSKILLDSLIKLNVSPNKTGNEKFPKNMPKEFFPDFLRGYFDGDGCLFVGTQKQNNKIYGLYNFKIVCANTKFLEQLKDGCGNLGSKIFVGNDHCSRWQVGSKKDIQTIGKLMYYPDFPFALQRKYNKFLEVGL